MSNIVVDIDSLIKTKKLMDNNYNELVMLFENYKNKVIDTSFIYDANSGNKYREITTKYLEKIDNYLKNNVKSQIDELDFIINSYTSTRDSIKESVGGNQ